MSLKQNDPETNAGSNRMDTDPSAEEVNELRDTLAETEPKASIDVLEEMLDMVNQR